jgi:3-hydroxypropanoate dehydrogenase
MTAALPDHSLDQIFRSARTFNGWAGRLEDATVREIYDLMKWGPTSANCSPARFVWVHIAPTERQRPPDWLLNRIGRKF